MEGRKPPGMRPKPLPLFSQHLKILHWEKFLKAWTVEKIGNLVEIVKGDLIEVVNLTESDTALVSIKSIMRGGGYRPR